MRNPQSQIQNRKPSKLNGGAQKKMPTPGRNQWGTNPRLDLMVIMAATYYFLICGLRPATFLPFRRHAPKTETLGAEIAVRRELLRVFRIKTMTKRKHF